MKGGTLFSGIAAPEVACPEIDWRWQAEIDPFACAVLRHRFPHIPNLGDVTRIDPDAVEPVDLVVFGSPCQSFSVAGKRLGLDDPRGNLALVALSLVQRIRPRWLAFENVPGLFSSFSGSELEERQVREGDVGESADGREDRDFAAFLSRLRECGYLGAWRVFDAQFTGVPQRRRRIFFVGYSGDWRPPTAVLFERESLRGDHPASAEARERIARPIASCSPGGSGWRADADTADNLIPQTAGAMTSAGGTDKKHGQGWGQQDWENGYAIPQVADPVSAHEQRTYTHEGTNNFRLRNVVAKSVRGQHNVAHREDTDTLIAVQCNGNNVGTDLPSLRAGNQHITGGGPAIAFSAKDHGADVGEIAPTLRAMNEIDGNANAGGQLAVAYGGNRQSGPLDAASAVRAKGGTGHGDFESETFIVATPIQNATRGKNQNGVGIGGEAMFTLDQGSQHAVAFAENTRNEVRTSAIMPQLTAGGGKPGQGYPAVAFKPSHYTRDKDGAPAEVTPPLSADADKGDQDTLVFESRFARNGRGAPSEVVPPLKAQSGQTGKGDGSPLLAAFQAVPERHAPGRPAPDPRRQQRLSASPRGC